MFMSPFQIWFEGIYDLAGGIPWGCACAPLSAGTNERGGGAPRRDKTKTAAGRSTLRCLLTHRLFQADKQFLESNRSFWARGNMHMDIIPMHISHIIIAVPRRFMLPSSSLYFAEAGRIITLLPSNVNPFFSFLHFS
jgi:hypothetical protein